MLLWWNSGIRGQYNNQLIIWYYHQSKAEKKWFMKKKKEIHWGHWVHTNLILRNWNASF